MITSMSGFSISGHRVVGDAGFAAFQGFAKRSRRDLLLGPAHFGQPFAGARRHQIGEADEVHAGGEAHLREEHGAELAGADLADAHGPAGGGALCKHG